MKKNLGSMLALYPTPATLVGAMVDGKPNWMQVAHVGIIGHDRIMISCMSNHYTNKGIRESGICSVSLCDQAMLKELDKAGGVSGSKEDKSNLLSWFEAENGAPVPEKAPLTLTCHVTDIYKTDKFDNFVLAIDATLVEEDKLDDMGKPDYGKISPVLFEFPTYSYYATGQKIGKCLSFK